MLSVAARTMLVKLTPYPISNLDTEVCIFVAEDVVEFMSAARAPTSCKGSTVNAHFVQSILKRNNLFLLLYGRILSRLIKHECL